MTRLLLSAALFASFFMAAGSASAQDEEELVNLQVYPEDITRDELIAEMRDFTFALGVRCQHCHYSPTGSFRDVDFASDSLAEKEVTRDMIRMLRTLNTELLPAVERRGDPPVEMTCKTCHRGRTRPFLLSQELLMTTRESGVDDAIQLYEQYREDTYGRGMFDFGETETNEVADQLAEEGLVDDAIALYEMNREYHPESLAIHASLGELYARSGRTQDAIAAWEKVLQIRPQHREATARLAELKGE